MRESSSSSSQRRCAACDAPLGGAFCAACGQEALAETRYSLAVFLRRSLAHVTNADSRLLRTFRTLLLRPGALTVTYFEGRRRPFLEPMQVFLIANVIYFVLAGPLGARSVNTSLSSHISAQNFFHQKLAASWVEDRIAARDTTFEAYEEVFDRRVNTLAKTLILVMIPVLALVLQLLERRRYFVEHLVYSAHFFSFFLLFLLALFGLLRTILLVNQIVGIPTELLEWPLWVLIELSPVIPLALYLGMAYRVTYQRRPWQAAGAGIILVLALFYFIILLYRAGLFFVTFAVT